jgi:hypothetical protein
LPPFGRVEDRRRCVKPVPFPIPRSSNRTCRFTASGFPTGFTADSQKSAKMNPTYSDHTQLTKTCSQGIGGTSRLYFMTPPQKVSRAHRCSGRVLDKPNNACHSYSSWTTIQNTIQSIPHLRPRFPLLGFRIFRNFGLKRDRLCLERLAPQIPMPILADSKVSWPCGPPLSRSVEPPLVCGPRKTADTRT